MLFTDLARIPLEYLQVCMWIYHYSMPLHVPYFKLKWNACTCMYLSNLLKYTFKVINKHLPGTCMIMFFLIWNCENYGTYIDCIKMIFLKAEFRNIGKYSWTVMNSNLRSFMTTYFFFSNLRLWKLCFYELHKWFSRKLVLELLW